MDPQTPKSIQMTDQELKKLLEEAVSDALTRIGIDAQNPLEMQKDFQHLREWREATTALQKKGMLTLVAILVTGASAAMWIGFKGMIGQ